jgi:hypothetical protein
MEQFEAWLSEQGVAVIGQVATGSGDLVRYDLRLPGGQQFEVVFSLAALVQRPEDAIERVREIMQHELGHRRGNGA